MALWSVLFFGKTAFECRKSKSANWPSLSVHFVGDWPWAPRAAGCTAGPSANGAFSSSASTEGARFPYTDTSTAITGFRNTESNLASLPPSGKSQLLYRRRFGPSATLRLIPSTLDTVTLQKDNAFHNRALPLPAEDEPPRTDHLGADPELGEPTRRWRSTDRPSRPSRAALRLRCEEYGGRAAQRGVWEYVYDDRDARLDLVLFAVDLGDRTRLAEAVGAFQQLFGLSEPPRRAKSGDDVRTDVPIVLVGCKADVDGGMDAEELMEAFDLVALLDVLDRPVRVVTCSSATGEVRLAREDADECVLLTRLPGGQGMDEVFDVIGAELGAPLLDEASLPLSRAQ